MVLLHSETGMEAVMRREAVPHAIDGVELGR